MNRHTPGGAECSSILQYHAIKYKEYVDKVHSMEYINRIKQLMKSTGFECKKYNYNLDKEGSSMQQFFATIKLSEDETELIIMNKKMKSKKINIKDLAGENAEGSNGNEEQHEENILK